MNPTFDMFRLFEPTFQQEQICPSNQDQYVSELLMN